MITDEQRKKLNEWFRSSDPKDDALNSTALQFAKAVMEIVPQGPVQDFILELIRMAWSSAVTESKR